MSRPYVKITTRFQHIRCIPFCCRMKPSVSQIFCRKRGGKPSLRFAWRAPWLSFEPFLEIFAIMSSTTTGALIFSTCVIVSVLGVSLASWKDQKKTVAAATPETVIAAVIPDVPLEVKDETPRWLLYMADSEFTSRHSKFQQLLTLNMICCIAQHNCISTRESAYSWRLFSSGAA